MAADHAIALLQEYASSQPTSLLIVDVADPVKPVQLCTLGPANGGRFLSRTKIAVWSGNKLGTADLLSGIVAQTLELPVAAGIGAVSADGTEVAYRVSDGAGGFTAHLYVAGSDRELYTQAPMGGHGGPPQELGPFNQLQFSADGKELLDYMTFRPGMPGLKVFKVDGSLLFEQSGMGPGVWSSTGSVLYFPVIIQLMPTGELEALDSSGKRTAVATGLQGFWFPQLAPSGSQIVFSADSQGLPYVSSVDLSSGKKVQLMSAASAAPVFIGPTTLWTNEEHHVECSIQGCTASDGIVLAHDLTTRRDTPVDSSFYQPPPGGPIPRFGTELVIDVTF